MNVGMLYSGLFCRFVCVLLVVAIATGPTAAVAAEAPPRDAEKRVISRPDTTLVAAPQAGKLDLRYVSPRAVIVAVARPKQLLTSTAAKLLPVEVASAAGLQYLGTDPIDVDEIVLFTEMPVAGPPDFGVTFKFAKPFAGKNIPERLRAHTQPGELAGKRYLQSTQPMLPSLYMPDDHTLVVAPDGALQRLVSPAPGGQAGPLVERIRDVAGGDDLYAAWDVASFRPLIAMGLAQQRPQIPPPFLPYLDIPNLIEIVELRGNLSHLGPSDLVCRANDEASAQRVESLIADGVQLYKSQVRAQIQNSMANDPNMQGPVGQAYQRYMDRMLEFSTGTQLPKRNGDTLVFFHTDGFDAEKQPAMAAITVAIAGILVALLLPAVQAAREAARRNQSMNNLKMLILSLHNYHDAKKTFPAHAIYSADGKPLLSWRVQVLPYLEEQALYNQFHLDEPWDSENNKPLIARMPAVFANPNLQLEAGRTNYLAVVGKECIFDGTQQGMRLAQISDGTSKTIALVEADADQAVEWTKPDDWEYDATKPSAGLGHLRPGGWQCAFADGSVHFIPNGIDPQILKALFTRNGREAVQVP